MMEFKIGDIVEWKSAPSAGLMKVSGYENRGTVLLTTDYPHHDPANPQKRVDPKAVRKTINKRTLNTHDAGLDLVVYRLADAVDDPRDTPRPEILSVDIRRRLFGSDKLEASVSVNYHDLIDAIKAVMEP